jgi:signal transduction histidine kinase
MTDTTPAPPVAGQATAPVRALPGKIRHDLRTQLNQILGYSDLLFDEAQGRGLDDLAQDLRRIHTAGKRLLALINEHVDPINLRADNAPPLSTPSGPAPIDTPVAEAMPIPSTAFASSEEASGARGALLVVEDDPANLDLLGRLLTRQGYTVNGAPDGPSAFERLAAFPCDLILLDLMLPGMDGIEVLQRLKSDAALRHLPVIMISALDAMEGVIRCIELGAEDYLPKPIDSTLLRARVEASLEKKRMRDREQRLFAQLQDNYRQLQNLERLRDDLVHMVVHDMRTPLTSLLTGLQTMEVLGELSPDQQEFLEMAIGGGQTLLGLINDLLDISRMEQGALPILRETVAPAELVADAMNQVTALARAKRIVLVNAVRDDLATFQADRDKLQRTLVNLLGNAVKHTPEEGTITACVEMDDAALHFSVQDTGEGIPPEAFERIFEKFGQVGGRSSDRKLSTGLGLTFCKMVVEAHGGRIGVQSAPGQGSTFTFSIPRPAN